MRKIKAGKVRIELDNRHLLSMLRSHGLAACDIRSLDVESRQQIRQLCLQACIENHEQ